MTRFDRPPPPDPPEPEALAERGRSLVAAAVAGTHASQDLRERLDAQRARALPARRRRRVRAALLGGVAAAAAVGIVVLALGGETSVPTVRATAALAAAGPALPAPAPDPANPVALRERVDGVAFPDWKTAFGWRATGARRDEIARRSATTVFYRGARGATIAYTILGGEAIDPIQGSRVRRAGDAVLWLTRDGDRTIVTWERGGHTCVMSAPAGVPEATLARLVAWDAGGGVPF